MANDRAPNPPDRSLQDDKLWASLRRQTAARIGLRRAGASLATGPLLDFQLAHARARDAVHAPLDEARLVADIAGLETPVLAVASAVEDRQHYLMRPDLGRRLGPGAEAMLAPYAGSHDVVLVVTDGLSAHAVQMHAQPGAGPMCYPSCAQKAWRIALPWLSSTSMDASGVLVMPSPSRLGASCVVVLIGERPGLMRRPTVWVRT